LTLNQSPLNWELIGSTEKYANWVRKEELERWV